MNAASGSSDTQAKREMVEAALRVGGRRGDLLFCAEPHGADRRVALGCDKDRRHPHGCGRRRRGQLMKGRRMSVVLQVFRH